MTIPKLQFDFRLNQEAELHPIIFTDPIEIIMTYQIDEIKPSLAKVEAAINNGHYVAGYMNYEASYAFYHTNQTIESDIPLLWFGVFNEPNATPEIPNLNNNFTVGTWAMQESKQIYSNNVREILQLIQDGHTEQVNYTVPFHASFHGDPYPYYEQLKRAQQANFNAFLQLEDLAILSVSPEKFFSIKDNTVSVKPMKGTVKRGMSSKKDMEQFRWLQQSEKDKVENDLITELMKDELERIADNIIIANRYEIETYPTVYQMTSTIHGDLKKEVHPVHVLRTLFPCGSITGVPKQKTVDIIATKEKANRGVYCGAIGYFTPNHEAIFNVAIRTVTINQKKQLAQYHAGGGITRSSTVDKEFEELIAKTDVLNKTLPTFSLLETFLLEDGTIFLKENHFSRLQCSAKYFNYNVNVANLNDIITDLQQTYSKGAWRIRLLLNKSGDITPEIFPLQKSAHSTVRLAKQPIDQNNVYLYHKTTERSMFDPHRDLLQENDLDILLWNQNGEITEFTIGNVVVEKEGKLITPPVECGLLPGTFREQLLKDEVIIEEKIFLDDLDELSSIWLINSVRKWVKVSLQKES